MSKLSSSSPVTGWALDSVALPPPMVPLGACGLPKLPVAGE
jgi:hypothetical protein